MTDVMTPPPAPPAAPGARPPRTSSRVIAILAIALGAAIVVGTVISSAVSTVAAASVTTDSRSVAVAGVDRLEVDVAAGSLRVEFADVTDAELDVTRTFGAGRWTLERDGDTLHVGSPEGVFWVPWVFGGNGTAVLRLPEALEGVDAALQSSTGDLSAAGSFGTVDLDIGAGNASIEGSATSVTASLSAGDADIDLDGVRTVGLTVSAGTMDAAFSGDQPRTVTADVSAGDLTMALPDGSYDVTSQVAAGDFDNRIGSTPGADSTVSVEVSAGSVTLRTPR